MTPEFQNIIKLIQESSLTEVQKAYFSKKIIDGNISEEFFNELEQALSMELESIDEELEHLNEELQNKEQELSEEKRKNTPKKQAIHQKLRSELKASFQNAIIQANHLAQKVEKTEELSIHTEELDEASQIRARLGI